MNPEAGGPYDLTINATGQGSVSMNPSGGPYNSGTTITLTANPSSGWDFSHWSGDLSGNNNTISVTIDADTNATAVFTEQSTQIPDDSCEDRCGNQAPDGCWCDNACVNYGDCCPDKQEQCN